jgi:pimeloyl-ACP methyl ester carboxylesterase
VNGEPRTGDPYGLGWLRLPVLLERGQNTFLFHLAGDRFSAKLAPPPGSVFLLDDDRTLPTLVRGETDAAWAAMPVVNASRDWLESAQIECQGKGGETVATPVAPIPPLSVRKVGFQMPPAGDAAGDEVTYSVRLVRPAIVATSPSATLAETDVPLRVVGPADEQVRTFKSRIDGSVQAYAIHPATAAAVAGEQPGLIVALHGAGDEAEEFLAHFAPKKWAHVVAPTGRRPYGFDWEDWGRADVLEVIDDVRQHFPSDPRLTYLTGHSMGGHGAWHLGVTYPDRFAAIGPSGGWPSFWSYGGGMLDFEDPDEIQALMLRGNAPSDTLSLLTNLAGDGIYVLHDADDQDVPVEQARFMRNRLAEFHPNFVYFERPGADDWSGDAGYDWPPMMEFFQHNSLPSPNERKTIAFTTADPGVSSRCGWVSIEAQQKPLQPSSVEIAQDVETRSFVGQTQNVARLAIDVGHWSSRRGGPIQVTLDGQQLPRLAWPEADEAGNSATTLWFERHDDRWSAASAPLPHSKGPRRSGPFKAAFDNDALLVYGTNGTPEENDWAEAKARYDAETFWYRGGGALEVLPDSRFDSHRDPERNVILYGNADTNRAWPALLADSPVQVRRGEVRFGTHAESGDDLAALFVYPRPASDTALVGVVAGTGPAGMRLTNRLRYFVSGVAYPDLMIFGPGVLAEGTSDVRAWGYFGPDWKVDTGDFAWRDSSL